MLLTNEATGHTWYYTFKNKDNVYKLFTEWKLMVKNQSGFKVKIVRIDNGTKYINNRFKNLFRATGIVYKLTAVYTPK